MIAKMLHRLLEDGRMPEDVGMAVGAAVDVGALEALAAAIRNDATIARLSMWNGRTTLTVEVEVPSGGHHPQGRSAKMLVSFVNGELQISPRDYDVGVPLAGVEQLQRAIGAVRARLDKEHRRALKRAKIEKLKQRGVEAQIQILAERHGFAYEVRPMRGKVRFSVKLDDTHCLEVDISLRRIEAAIASLPDLIGGVRGMFAPGMQVQIQVRDTKGFKQIP